MESNQSWEAFLLTQTKAKNVLLQKEVPLSALCTFRIGGNAKQVIYPQDAQTFCEAICRLRSAKIGYFVIGCASNLLFSDRGFDGVIVSTKYLNDFARIGNTLTVSAGVPLAHLCHLARFCGLSGAEFTCGIPGSVGGAICQNAGAFGHQMADLVMESCAYDIENNRLVFYDRDAHRFGYRKSIYQEKKALLLSATLSLIPSEKEKIDQEIKEYARRRAASQPHGVPSAGSVFLRCEDGTPAALYLDRAGLKGYRIGDAKVSEVHAGFIVNCGHARARDVLALIDYCKTIVKEKYGVLLQTELETVE